MKILLLNLSIEVDQEQASARFFPQNLALISALLKNSGQEVELLDLYQHGLNKSLLISKAKESDAIAFGGMINQFKIMRQISKWLKEANPELPLIIGGSLVSAAPKLIKKALSAEVIISGEAEIALNQVFADQKINGGIYQTEKMCDLNQQPNPDFNLFDVNWYLSGSQRVHLQNLFGDRKTLNNYIFSRGCPNQCKFCFKGFGHKVRTLNFECVLKQLDYFWQQGMSAINFQDDNFTSLPQNFLKALCLELAKRNIVWTAHSRVDQVNEDILRLFKASGCKALKFGLESFSPKALKDAGKNISIKQTKIALEMVRQTNIKPIAFIILGLPGETKKAIKELLEFVKTNQISTIPYILCPLPGTYYFEQAQKQGLIANPLMFLEKCSGWEKNQISAGKLYANLTDLPDNLILETYQELQSLNQKTP